MKFALQDTGRGTVGFWWRTPGHGRLNTKQRMKAQKILLRFWGKRDNAVGQRKIRGRKESGLGGKEIKSRKSRKILQPHEL